MLVVVTGGAGFIGSATVELLLEQLKQERISGVLIVDNLYSGKLENISHFIDGEKVRFVLLDVSSSKDVEEKLQGYLAPFRGDIAIIHLAAVVNIVEVYQHPGLAVAVNVGGTINMLEVARRYDARRFILASSVAVYGEPRYIPIDEDHPLEPANLYGETKLMAERLVCRYNREYGLSTIILRYFNVYGPRMREGVYAGVVYKFITALLKKEQPVVYGDGMQTRDFVFVYDVADANIRAMYSNYIGVLNIGSGVEVRILDLLKMLENIIGYSIPPRFEEARRGDVRRSCAKIDRAVEVLGWRPKHTLHEGLRITVDYYRSQLKP